MLVVLAMLILPWPVTLPMMEVVGRTMVDVVSAVVVTILGATEDAWPIGALDPMAVAGPARLGGITGT